MDQFQLSLAPGKNEDYAMGGGLEGASRMSRELLSWQPRIISPADMISQDKELADLRAADAMNNQGMVRGAVETHKDSIVGSQYRLNARPNLRALGRKDDEVWSNEFQEAIEGRFNLLGASTECWFDASRINSFTGLIRMTIAQAFGHGEALGTAEWMPAQGRPFQTAIQMIHPLRLSNPFNTADTATLKSGQEIDKYGATQFYWIRGCHPGDSTQLLENWEWKKVAARKPWGRRQVLHVFDQETPGQPRGISSIVAALKDMHMSKRFREVTLQNAVINASYAAAIESELPKEMVFQQMGGMNQVAGFTSLMDTYMQMISTFMGGAKNVRIDGSTIPVLMPGTKLNLTPIGTPGGVGTEFEVSMLRHIAATLGLSYEEFSRDWTKTNYSSARAGMSQTEKHMKARKKTFADRMASMIYRLWLEEEVDKGTVPMPAGMNRRTWYDDPTVQEALSAATWIGSGRGQIDELKETQAAALRVGKNFSTDEAEAAKLGEDWREIYAQRAREEREKQRLGLPNLIDDLEAQRAGVQAADDAKKQAKADANQPTGNEKPAKAEHDHAEDQLEQIQGDSGMTKAVAMQAVNSMSNAPALLGANMTPNTMESTLTAMAGETLASADERSREVRNALCAAYGFNPQSQNKPFVFSDGVAVIPVHGLLLNRFGDSYGYVTGYTFIRRQRDLAMADPDVKLVIYDVNSGGGEAAGNFELAQESFDMRGTKPTFAIVNSNCYSAAYAFASSADKIYVTPSGGAGSIGVVATHFDVSKMLDNYGIKVTFIHAGEHKVDGNSFEPLSDEVKADIQARVDATYGRFVDLVAQNRGLDPKAVRRPRRGATQPKTHWH